MPNVGAELASVPFGKMIYDMASAIARSQIALDKASIQLVNVLANTTFDYVPDVTEVLLPNVKNVPGVMDSQGNQLTITGVKVESVVGDSFPLTLLQAGVNPTFYAFTNSTIEVKMSITSTQESSNTLSVGVSVQASADFLFASGSVSSHVNYTTSNKYSYSVTGSSSMSTTLAPVPPPKNMMPRFFLVNAIDPSKVSVSQS
ncbi:hypothetical protein [Granulicella aggregans]|uniref:hypothetical protein n=1 Tax=Granulicella aggregans TaxID=474949 RepID=UPI0021E01720|nr:hypothetical protein [Granulicella aggregans]